MEVQLRWTDKQIEIAQLIEEGKPFKDIVALGHTKSLVSKVKKALEEGQRPEPEPRTEAKGSNDKRDLLGVVVPKLAPITFKVDRKEIVLDPLALYNQYRYYQDLAKKDGMSYSFSEVQTIGVQLIWILTQNIPLTENMIAGILYG